MSYRSDRHREQRYLTLPYHMVRAYRPMTLVRSAIRCSVLYRFELHRHVLALRHTLYQAIGTLVDLSYLSLVTWALLFSSWHKLRVGRFRQARVLEPTADTMHMTAW